MGYVSQDPNLPVRRAFTNKLKASPLANGGPVENSVCRYYQAGYCRRGSSCHFAHSSKSESPFVITSPPYRPGEGDGQRVDLMGGRADHSLPPACFPSNQAPVYYASNSQAVSPFLWQPYPPLIPHFGLPQPPDFYPDYPDDNSDPSSSEASSTATHFECDVRQVPTQMYSPSIIRGSVAPHLSHGVSQSSEYTDYSGNPKLEGFAPCGATASLAHHPVNRFAIVYPQALFLPWQDDSKRKPLAYKTKPCRFYAANGKCTSGDKCTFIHDAESDKDKTSPAQPLDAHLPPKPVTKYEQYRAKDFYPISWRVIGGGVMMGGERKFCRAFAAGYCEYGDDCKLAHETELEAHPDGILELRAGSIPTGIISRCETPNSPMQDKVPRRARSRRRKLPALSSPEPDQPGSAPHSQSDKDEKAVASANSSGPIQRMNRMEVNASDVSTFPCRRRARSMSTPASTSPLVSHMATSTFAAEL